MDYEPCLEAQWYAGPIQEGTRYQGTFPSSLEPNGFADPAKGWSGTPPPPADPPASGEGL